MRFHPFPTLAYAYANDDVEMFEDACNMFSYSEDNIAFIMSQIVQGRMPIIRNRVLRLMCKESKFMIAVIDADEKYVYFSMNEPTPEKVITAIKSGNRKMINSTLKTGNVVREHGLFAAVVLGSCDVVDMFLEKGFPVTPKVIDTALEQGHIEILNRFQGAVLESKHWRLIQRFKERLDANAFLSIDQRIIGLLDTRQHVGV